MKKSIYFLIIGFTIFAGCITQSSFVDETILFQHPFGCGVMPDDAGMETVEAALLVDEAVVPEIMEGIRNGHAHGLGTYALSAVFWQ